MGVISTGESASYPVRNQRFKGAIEGGSYKQVECPRNTREFRVDVQVDVYPEF
jgi:hypothetical protein